jgi:hypothetical protein
MSSVGLRRPVLDLIHPIHPLIAALQSDLTAGSQRGDLLAFAGVLDHKVAVIAQTYSIGEPIVRKAYVFHRLPSRSSAY